MLVTGKFINEIPRGQGSAAVPGYNNVTLAKALREVFGNNVVFIADPSEETIREADAVIVSVGTVDSESVERPFALPSKEEAAVKKIVAANANTIVLVNSGSGHTHDRLGR